MRENRFRLPTLLIILGSIEAAMAEPDLLASACSVTYRDLALHRLGDAILLDASEELDPEVLEKAISHWAQCRGYGEEFPHFATRGHADRVLRVRLEKGRPGDGHCGTLFRGEIVLYRTARDDLGRLRPCGAISENLAHELGHALGLGDAAKSSVCRFAIMSPLSSSQRKNGVGRHVSPNECRAVATHWLTWDEQEEQERRARLAAGAEEASEP